MIKLSAVKALVTACEAAYTTGPAMDEFDDDEDISFPPSGITFGMIREARKELEARSFKRFMAINFRKRNNDIYY